MFKIIRKEIEWAGRKLTLETGKIARQADGAVVATYGDTVLLCTAVSAKKAKEGIDFFPLTVHYQEKAFAAGKIPGGFFKREGRPSEREILVSRLIDRPIRPLFPEHFHNETQVVCTVLSHDPINDPDIVAIVGASAALAISGIPMLEPIAAARVGYVGGQYLLNPEPKDMEVSDLDLVVAGTESSVLMVESEANCLPEKIMLDAVVFGHQAMQPIIQMIREMAAEVNHARMQVAEPEYKALKARIETLAASDLRAAYALQAKQERRDRLDVTKKRVMETLKSEATEAAPLDEVLATYLFKSLEKDIVRGNILERGHRIDGRGVTDVRQIVTEVGLLPRTHGSALFTRGETQALAVTTLGTSQDEQTIDSLSGDSKEHFMLHYNFPPFSVGEATPMRAPGRREIGHGKLAWRAIRPMLPTKEAFPYTLRIVSEVTESNGSSSMATVCGASLALMDAGVPLKSSVAGIAMGLIKEGDKYAVLSDIMGDEDHLGDMDFKVAGTKDGITALQMDIKINGITPEIMEKALHQAQAGRLHILGKMAESMTGANTELRETAPRITAIKINREKIGELIGPGGKMIREICETSGAKIDIEDDGTVKVAAVNQESAAEAIRQIMDIVSEAELGKIYTGKVMKTMEFGAVVQFLGKSSGLVHISELSEQRVERVEDVVSEGQSVKVKVIGKERGDRGDRIRLSIRQVNQETGEDIGEPVTASEGGENGGGDRPAYRPRRDDRGGDRPRGGDRGDRPRRDRDDRGGDRPRREDRPRDDRPREDRPRRDDRPRDDRPRGDRDNRGGDRRGGDRFRDRGEDRRGGSRENFRRDERRPELDDDSRGNREEFNNNAPAAPSEPQKKRRWFL